MFTYSHVCPLCGTTFEQTRKKPYKKVRVRKTCPSCKKSEDRSDVAIEFGGLGSDTACRSCVHFGVHASVPTNRWWQKCGQGKYSVDGEGNLVYLEDLCEEHEPYED